MFYNVHSEICFYQITNLADLLKKEVGRTHFQAKWDIETTFFNQLSRKQQTSFHKKPIQS